MVLVAVGNITIDELQVIADKEFSDIPATNTRDTLIPATYSNGIVVKERPDFEQVQAYVSWNSVSVFDPEYYAHRILASVLGGGMSSPLFQEVREKRGLVYSIGAGSYPGEDFGSFLIYGGATPAKVAEMLTISGQELKKLTSTIQEQDFIRSINQALIGLSIFKEKPEKMMSTIASYFLTTRKLLDLDKERDAYLSVSVDDVKNAARKILEGKPVISLVGPLLDADYESIVATSIE